MNDKETPDVQGSKIFTTWIEVGIVKTIDIDFGSVPKIQYLLELPSVNLHVKPCVSFRRDVGSEHQFVAAYIITVILCTVVNYPYL